MSKERHETVADVVAAMRQDIANGTVGIWSDFGGEIARSHADRIEVAHRRFYDKYKEHTNELNSKLNREVEELRKENALLRSAMKPILECKVMSAMTAEIEPGRSDYCAAIIEKAQRIYKESREGEAKCTAAKRA